MDLLSVTFILLALVISITLHEAAHAYMGDRLGDETARREGRLTLNPVSHIDPFLTLLLPLLLFFTGNPVFGAAKPVPFNPWAVKFGKWGAALVALAGPATNLVIAMVLALWLQFVPGSDLSQQFLLLTIQLNIAFFVFNMLPIPPLDGSRLVYAAFAPIRPLFDAIERAGLILVFLIIFVGYQYIATFVGGATQLIMTLLLS